MVGSVNLVVSRLTPCQVRAQHRQLSAELVREANASGLRTRGVLARLDILASRSEELIGRSCATRNPKPLRNRKRPAVAT